LSPIWGIQFAPEYSLDLPIKSVVRPLTGLNLGENIMALSCGVGLNELVTDFIDHTTFDSFLHYVIEARAARVVTGLARLLSQRVTNLPPLKPIAPPSPPPEAHCQFGHKALS